MTDRRLKATSSATSHDAMRARDKVRSGTLRMALTAITNAEVAGDEARELSDDEVLKVLAKEAKKRKEASAAYTDAGRPELAAIEDAELVVLEAYLPAQLADDELGRIVARAVASTGATGMPQMGLVMKAAQAEVAGRADGGRVAAVVKQVLVRAEPGLRGAWVRACPCRCGRAAVAGAAAAWRLRPASGWAAWLPAASGAAAAGGRTPVEMYRPITSRRGSAEPGGSVYATVPAAMAAVRPGRPRSR